MTTDAAPTMGEEAKLVKDDNGLQYFEQGGVRVPLDPDSVIKTVDQVDKLNAGAWVALARANNIQTDPFDKKLLKPVIMGIVQNFWYQAIKGQVPEKCVLNHEVRVKKYHQELEQLKSNPDAAVTRRTERAPSAPRSVKAYRLTTEKQAEWEKYKGQKDLIIQAMIKMGAMPEGGNAVTVAMVADSIKHQLETKQTPERVVAFYMSDWQHRGVVEVVGEQTRMPAPKAEPEPPAPTPEAPAPEVKKSKNKKK